MSASSSRIGTPLTPKEQRAHAQEQREVERLSDVEIIARARKRGFVKVKVRDAHGQPITQNRRRSIIDSLKLEVHQLAAYERFAADVYLSGEDNLRAAGLEPGVDGGRADMHRAHLIRKFHDDRRMKAAGRIGSRDYEIMMACYNGASAQDLHALGGPEHVLIGNDVKKILNDLSAFYTGGARPMDSLWRASGNFNELSKRDAIKYIDNEMVSVVSGTERSLTDISVSSSKRRAKVGLDAQ